MWPFPSPPTQADRDLAQRLLDQATLLNQMAARLLRLSVPAGPRPGQAPDLDSGSTSSPPSTASSSSTPRTKLRGLESVSILDRETLYQQDLRRSAERIPETRLEPEPVSDPSPSMVPNHVTGGFRPVPPDG